MSWPIGSDLRSRALDVIARDGLDALLALTSENARHLGGVPNFIATRWRTPGLAATALAATGAAGIVTGDNGVILPAGAFTSHRQYTLWTDYIDLRGFSGGIAAAWNALRPAGPPPRPAQYDPAEIVDAIAAMLDDLGLSCARIGVELDALSPAFLLRLRQRLPALDLVDAAARFDDLRAIKDADELADLRLAGELTEFGLAAAIDAIAIGQTEAQLSAIYQRAILDRVTSDPALGAVRDVEGLVSVGITGTDRVVGPGVVVKFDMQVDVAGQHSDLGRTVAIAPTAAQRTLHGALRNALLTMRDRVRPGVTFADLFATGMGVMHDHGFTTYSRGHLGHSIGLTPHFEEAPFIAPTEPRPLVPGMALSLEMPAYVLGVGAFQLETMVFVTDDGCEILDTLPWHLDLDQARAHR